MSETRSISRAELNLLKKAGSKIRNCNGFNIRGKEILAAGFFQMSFFNFGGIISFRPRRTLYKGVHA